MRIESKRLILRNWRDNELPIFHRLNSDKAVMAFFPWRFTLEQSTQRFNNQRADLANNSYGFAAIEDKASGQIVGMSGLLRVDWVGPFPLGATEIGWRLLPEHFGKGYASEAAQALVNYGFEQLGLNHILAFAVETNLPSIRVMQRIGMSELPESGFDHPKVPDTHPELKRHVLYGLDRKHWSVSSLGGVT